MPAPPSVVPTTIHFAFDSSVIDAGQLAVLKHFVSTLGAQPTAIAIKARTDPRGTERHNARLAIQRAESVKAALITLGVPARIIDASAASPCCDGALTAPEEVHKNLRRAIVTASAAPGAIAPNNKSQ
jgi:outer membrane protein OmpA-like peptidoglycan-associated protein